MVFVVGIFGFVLMLIGRVAIELGVASTFLSSPTATPTAPDGGFIENLVAFGKWVIDSMAAIFQIMTFQVQIDPVLNALIMFPIAIMILYIGIRTVRGGG